MNNKLNILAKRQLFKQQVINDLAWVIASPGLLNSDHHYVLNNEQCQKFYEDIENRLIEWDTHSETLPKQLSAPRPYVGDYFENLIAFWLKNRKGIEQFNQRQTVFENKRTLGEFDFLFHHTQLQKSFHWEVAIKYYLYYESGGDAIFYGPNSRDRLSIKVDKMFNQQILLSKQLAAKCIIEQYPTPICPQILLKGYLFYPSHKLNSDKFNIPDYISSSHLRGWWSYANDPVIPKHHVDSQWFILNKPHWLAIPRQPKSLLDYNSLQDIIRVHFNRSQKPLFLAEVMQNSDGEYLETSRGFIVPNNWPKSQGFANKEKTNSQF